MGVLNQFIVICSIVKPKEIPPLSRKRRDEGEVEGLISKCELKHQPRCASLGKGPGEVVT